MVWKQLVVAGALAAACSSATALMIDGCPDGTFPVSVLDDPKVHCLSGRPCSGAFSVNGIPQGVGACPGSSGCALLPHNEAIMGCVASGRGDVAYVNADGSLTRGGKVVSVQDATNSNNNNQAAVTKTDSVNGANGANANNNNAIPSAATTSLNGATPTTTIAATVAPSNLDGLVKSDSIISNAPSSTAAAIGSPSGAPTTAPSTTTGLRGSKSGSGSTDAVPSPTPTPTESPTPTPTQAVEHVTAQQTLNDIDGDSKTNKGGSVPTAGVSIGSVIGIVVGCLAIVAVVAGVRLLKKDKESVVETPEGGLDAYGGGITPKEDVVLL